MLRPAHLLRHEAFSAFLTANPVRLAILLCSVWTVLGLVGHDPWKPDEAHTFGVVYGVLQGGDWLVPMLAGEPYMIKPPLAYLSAALSALVFSPILPLHEGARLSTGFYMLLTFLLTGLTARELFGGNKTWVAPLMLLGCVGLLARGHQLITDVVLLSGFAMSLYALALSARRPVHAGYWLGTGLGISILSTGLVEPLMIVLTMAILPAASAHWRTRDYARTAAIGLAVMLPWALIWPLLLKFGAPAQFDEWFWVENMQRLKGMFTFGAEEEYYYFVNLLPWFAWPAWPFALWSLWAAKADALRKPEFVLPLTALLVFLAFLSVLGEGHDVYGLPLLLPLSLLGAPAFDTLKRGASNAFYWFAIMLFLFFAIVGWFYWMAIDLGIPAQLHQHMLKLQPAYTSGGREAVVVLAALFTAGWLVMLFNFKRIPERPVVIWASGISLLWVIVALLLVRYIDTGKSYRSVVEQMAKALPAQHGCIYGQALSEPQRAMLHYFGGILTVRLEKSRNRPDCDLLIVADNAKKPTHVGGPWKLVWQGSRPAEKQERFRLFHRQ